MALKNNRYLNSSIDEETEEIIDQEVLQHRDRGGHRGRADRSGGKDGRAKGIMDLAEEIPNLAEKANSRKVDMADLKGGTFTITNWGTLAGPTERRS